jgi:hypothetical protein
MSADGFLIFWLSFFEENPNKVSACFYETLTTVKNPYSYPLQGSCSGFPEAACDSKSCSESRL